MKEETERWLDKAEKDLDDGIYNFKGERDELAAFLFQQAVEKALKAIQIEERGEHGFTHDLISLSDEETYDRFEELLLDLNPVYTGFRYPDVEASDIEDIEKIKNRTEELITWTKKRLKG